MLHPLVHEVLLALTRLARDVWEIPVCGHDDIAGFVEELDYVCLELHAILLTNERFRFTAIAIEVTAVNSKL